MKTFVRDSTVRLKFNFFDHVGDPLNPTTAQVTISYMPHDGSDPTFVTYTLTQTATIGHTPGIRVWQRQALSRHMRRRLIQCRWRQSMQNSG